MGSARQDLAAIVTLQAKVRIGKMVADGDHIDFERLAPGTDRMREHGTLYSEGGSTEDEDRLIAMMVTWMATYAENVQNHRLLE